MFHPVAVQTILNPPMRESAKPIPKIEHPSPCCPENIAIYQSLLVPSMAI